ncbi:hypothetical protein KAI65_06310, partial [Candidatus Parcubacteria bacterium]|nr:hypothetical protein [Candidatus Parcubacteria bacterium]
MGSFLGVLLILFVPEWRTQIVKHQKGQKTPRNLGFFLSVRFLAAIAFIMLNWAIKMGNVALISSLQGTQYIFLILLVIFLSTRFPKILKEELDREIMLQKIMGTAMIVIGLYMLAV